MGNSMATRKKTQSPVTGKAARKTASKKPAPKKAAGKKDEPKPAQDPSQSQLFEQFNTVWSAKWSEMLREKGWPDSFTPPDAGQMPFMLPFMMPAMGPTISPSAAADPHIHTLVSSITMLEKRIMELEEKLAQRSTTKPRKSGK